MHVWTKPICWNHRGNHEQNSMFETKRKASGLFCFFSSPSCFLTTCQDLAQAWILTAIQKAPNHRLAAKASDQPPTLSLPASVSLSLAHQNGLMGHFIVLFCSRGGRREERGREKGLFWTQSQLCALWFFCCFWKFANTIATTASFSLGFAFSHPGFPSALSLSSFFLTLWAKTDSALRQSQVSAWNDVRCHLIANNCCSK